MITTAEMLDLLNSKPVRNTSNLEPITYDQLRIALARLKITLYSRAVNGYRLQCYLDKEAVHKIADYFGTILHPSNAIPSNIRRS